MNDIFTQEHFVAFLIISFLSLAIIAVGLIIIHVLLHAIRSTYRWIIEFFTDGY